jgi:hypothetical protein
MEKYFPAVFTKFFHHKNNYIFKKVQKNLKRVLKKGFSDRN